MQTRSKTIAQPTLCVDSAKESAPILSATTDLSFETRRSKRLQALGHTSIAFEVEEWLNAKTVANNNNNATDYDSDNDSTSTYNTEDADADNHNADTFEPEPISRITTRSVTLYRPTYNVDIDFDEASVAWRANKRLVGEGHYAYTHNTRSKKTSNAKPIIVNSSRIQTRSLTAANKANAK